MTRSNGDIRYEPDERCPPLVAAGVGAQGVALALPPMVVNVAVVFRSAGQSESDLAWAVFAALAIAGVTTALQAARFGRVGAGHLVISGPAPIFIAICVSALAAGGAATMASLLAVSSLGQFALARCLPLLRRIVTPAVSGTVMMLIAYTIVPIALDMIDDVPDSALPGAAPAIAATTLAVAAAMALRASGPWRLWSPLIGIAAGCTVAGPFGAFDFRGVAEAPWIAVPGGGWPGLELAPSAEFWALLPVFMVVTAMLAVNTVSDGIVVQTIARRRPRATDFRVVQGAVNANGIGALLSGLAGTLPTMGYTAVNTSLVSLTGVAARTVGFAVALILVGLALLPKLAALLLAIPAPVVGAYFIVLMAMLFVAGARTALQGGFDARNATIVGLAFWLGVGAQNQAIFADRLHGAWEVLLGNGMTVGALAAVSMTVFLELAGPRRTRLRVGLGPSAFAEVDTFLRGLASKMGWNADAAQRLCAAGEETLAILLARGGDGAEERSLFVTARPDDGAAAVEFLAAAGGENLEDRVAYLSEQPEAPDERDVPLRLLRHYANSVEHRQYHGVDVLTIRVEDPG